MTKYDQIMNHIYIFFSNIVIVSTSWKEVQIFPEFSLNALIFQAISLSFLSVVKQILCTVSSGVWNPTYNTQPPPVFPNGNPSSNQTTPNSAWEFTLLPPENQQ